MQVPPVVPYKAPEKFPKALYRGQGEVLAVHNFSVLSWVIKNKNIKVYTFRRQCGQQPLKTSQ